MIALEIRQSDLQIEYDMHVVLQDDLYADEMQSRKLMATRQRRPAQNKGKKKAKRMSMARRVSAPTIRKRFK